MGLKPLNARILGLDQGLLVCDQNRNFLNLSFQHFNLRLSVRRDWPRHIGKPRLGGVQFVSKAENLAHVEAALKKVHPVATRVIAMAQGQKQSRLIAWTFCGNGEMERWRKARWADQS